MQFQFIESSSEVLGGKPCIKGTRISVEIILEWLASGASVDDIAAKFPHLPKAGIQEAILYASKFMQNEITIVTKPAVGSGVN
ncbi:MAG: DUF433 domain-containing protein [Bacteroidia bacterium]